MARAIDQIRGVMIPQGPYSGSLSGMPGGATPPSGTDPPSFAGDPAGGPSMGPDAWGTMPPPVPVESPAPFLIGPPTPSTKHQEEAEEYIKACCKESVDFIQTKLQRLKRLQLLYRNQLPLSQWTDLGALNTSLSRKNTAQRSEGPRWYSDLVVAVSPIVDQRVEALVNQVFANEDFFEVIPEEGPDPVIDSADFPTSRKLQAYLIRSLNSQNFRARLREYCWQGVLYGVCLGKAVWREDYVRQWLTDPSTMQDFSQDDIVAQGTQLQVVNLAKALIDPHAKSGDCQEWGYVGHREMVPYDTLKRRFGTTKDPGPYNLNKAEFNIRWQDGQSLDSVQWEINEDPDAYTATSAQRYLQVWEWHGKVWFSDEDRAVECNATLITDAHSDNPSSGLMVRLYETTTVVTGQRPFVYWQYAPCSEVFAPGIIEQNQDLIYQISSLSNMYLDAIRLAVVPMMKARKGSFAVREAQSADKGNVIFPGKIWQFEDDPNEIQSFQMQLNGLQFILEKIQWLETQLQKRTSVTDISRGFGPSHVSATQASAVASATAAPVQAVVSTFEHEVLRPFGQLCLAQLQQFVLEDQEIKIKTKDGEFKPVLLTVEELQEGQYSVRAALSSESQGRVSKAQIIAQQVLPLLQNYSPMLQAEGKKISFSGLLEEVLRLLSVNKIDNIIQDISPEERAAQQQAMAGPPPGLPPGPPQGPDMMGQGSPSGGPIPGAPQGPGGGPPIPPELIQQYSQLAGGSTQGTPSSPDGSGGPISTQLEQMLNDLRQQGQSEAPMERG